VCANCFLNFDLTGNVENTLHGFAMILELERAVSVDFSYTYEVALFKFSYFGHRHRYGCGAPPNKDQLQAYFDNMFTLAQKSGMLNHIRCTDGQDNELQLEGLCLLYDAVLAAVLVFRLRVCLPDELQLEDVLQAYHAGAHALLSAARAYHMYSIG
jgi:hypothetical protein